MIRKILFWIILINLTGCLSQEQKMLKLYGEKPKWINQTPNEPNYYIGIASINKNNPDYKNAAVRLALDNLANEISVVVSSASVLNTIENNQKFQQEYSQNIQISSKADLEGHQLMDDWEDKTHYYVYYQLSKQKHQEIRQEKIKSAIDRAKNLYIIGNQLESKNKYRDAFVNYVQALDVLSNYLNQNLSANLNNKTINLPNEILNSIRNLQNEIVLEPSFKSKNILLGETILSNVIFVQVKNSSGQLLSGIPILFEYHTIFTQSENVFSNNDGIANFSIGKIKNNKKTQEINYSLNLNQLAIESSQNRMLISLLNLGKSNQNQITLNLDLPKIYLEEKSILGGKTMIQSLPLSSEIKKAIIDNNFELGTQKNLANLILSYELNYNSFINNDGLHVVTCDGNFEVNQNGITIFSTSIPSQKGTHLSENEALAESNKKIGALFNSRLIPQFANQYFQY